MKEKLIQNHLTEKFQKVGFYSFSMDDIAIELSISKKTIYKYYKNKHDLVNDILTGLLESAYKKVIITIASKSPFLDKYYSIFDIVKKNLRAFDDISLRALKNYYPDIWVKIARFRKYNILPLLRLLISSGIKKGVLNDYPVELYLKIIYGSIQEVTKRDAKPIEGELDILLKMILNGALTKKGKKFLNYNVVNVN